MIKLVLYSSNNAKQIFKEILQNYYNNDATSKFYAHLKEPPFTFKHANKTQEIRDFTEELAKKTAGTKYAPLYHFCKYHKCEFLGGLPLINGRSDIKPEEIILHECFRDLIRAYLFSVSGKDFCISVLQNYDRSTEVLKQMMVDLQALMKILKTQWLACQAENTVNFTVGIRGILNPDPVESSTLLEKKESPAPVVSRVPPQDTRIENSKLVVLHAGNKATQSHGMNPNGMLAPPTSVKSPRVGTRDNQDSNKNRKFTPFNFCSLI